MRLNRKLQDFRIDWWRSAELKEAVEEALLPMEIIIGGRIGLSVNAVIGNVNAHHPKDLEIAKKIVHMMVEEWMKTRAIHVSEMNRRANVVKIVATDAPEDTAKSKTESLSVTVDGDGNLALPADVPWVN